MRPTKNKIIERARELYHVEGELEVDENAKVNRSTDGGSYVQAWIWIYDDEIKGE